MPATFEHLTGNREPSLVELFQKHLVARADEVIAQKTRPSEVERAVWERVSMKRYLVSTGTLPMAVGKEFCDYQGIFEAIRELTVDGIELVFLPEWDRRHPPLTPTSADWNSTPKIEPSEVVDLCLAEGLSVPVVHINRDVGNMLCSTERERVLEGQRILGENLAGACVLGSKIAVLHMWDTYAESIDVEHLFSKVHEVAKDCQIQLAIENIPLSDRNLTMAKAWQLLREIMPEAYGFTLDLNWCSLYDNLAELKTHVDRVLDVHIQGAVSLNDDGACVIRPRAGQLDIVSSLAELCELGYDGFMTLELNRPKGLGDFKAALDLVRRSSS